MMELKINIPPGAVVLVMGFPQGAVVLLMGLIGKVYKLYYRVFNHSGESQI
jgi:hypothetical protein